MKMLVTTESLEVWGAENTLLELAKHADRKSCEMTFLVAPGSPLAPLLANLGLRVVFHNFAIHPALVQYGGLGGANFKTLLAEVAHTVWGGIRLVRVIRGYDLILSFSMWQSIETAIGSAIARRPFVLDIHETFSGKRGNQIIRSLAKMAQLVIAPSQAILSRSGIAPRRSIAVIPRPVATTLLTHSRENLTSVTVGIFGQISPHKGVEKVVSAIAQLMDSRVRLLVVGGRPEGTRSEYESRVRSAVSAMGGGSEVVERVPDVFGVMSSCDFVVNASDHEAFGRGIVEAIASGAVPIAVGHEGPSEIIHDTGIGIVVSNTDELAGLIKDLLDGSIEWPRVDATARDQAVARYDPATVTKQYLDRLTQVIRS